MYPGPIVMPSFDPRGSDAVMAERVDTVPIQTTIRTTHRRPMFEMVMTGMGIGILEAPACSEAIERGRLVRLLADYELRPLALNLLIRPQRPVPARVRKIVDILRSYVAEALGVDR